MEIHAVHPDLCDSKNAYSFASYLMEKALGEESLSGSLVNCHDEGIDSIVLFDRRNQGGGMARIFIANHNSHNLDEVYGPDGNFVIGVHDHRFDLRIIPLIGQLDNVEVTPGDRPVEGVLHEHVFRSGLATGQMQTEYCRELPIEKMHTREMHPGESMAMKHSDLHTVHVPKTNNDYAAWMLLEGPDVGKDPHIYSVNRNLKLSAEGLYIPMPEEVARQKIEAILNRPK